MVDYKVFNEASHVDCMLQVQEAKDIGIKGEVKPKITKILERNLILLSFY